MALPDGRVVAYREYGDPVGAPCLYLPGTPVSALAGAAYDDAARRRGVRWLCLDKPGYGRSSPHRSGTLRSFAHDVGAVADSLGLTTFAVAGESGGGPYALAAAYELPGRVSRVLLMAAMGPGHEAWARDGMKPFNRLLLTLAQRAPWAIRLPLTRLRRISLDPRRSDRYAAREARHLPPEDLAVQRQWGFVDQASVADAFAQGVEGAVRESQLLAGVWGFELGDVVTPVESWHGTADVNVPVALARAVVQRLPDGTLHLLDGVGHAAGHVAEDDIMRAVRNSTAPTLG